MHASSTAAIPDFIRARAGAAGTSDVAAASLLNHSRTAGEALVDARYRAAKTGRLPRKIGSHLHLLDCINCDKCIPVCPNDANFVYDTPPRTIVYRDLVVRGGQLSAGDERTLTLGGKDASTHQIANWAGACNDCGNCDVFCPEDGGPYIEKPRLFESLALFRADAPHPGFFVRREATARSPPTGAGEAARSSSSSRPAARRSSGTASRSCGSRPPRPRLPRRRALLASAARRATSCPSGTTTRCARS